MSERIHWDLEVGGCQFSLLCLSPQQGVIIVQALFLSVVYRTNWHHGRYSQNSHAENLFSWSSKTPSTKRVWLCVWCLSNDRPFVRLLFLSPHRGTYSSRGAVSSSLSILVRKKNNPYKTKTCERPCIA